MVVFSFNLLGRNFCKVFRFFVLDFRGGGGGVYVCFWLDWGLLWGWLEFRLYVGCGFLL